MSDNTQLDGHVIEQCVNAGDGLFKEGAWVKIGEEYQNHPERAQLAKFVGKYGRLTRRYHGCWCVKWLEREEAVSQALGQSSRSDGPWELCKLGREFHETWLCYVQKVEMDQLTLSTRRSLATG